MDPQLVIAVLLAIGFAAANGIHDASNAIATLVATRAATPLQAIVLASVPAVPWGSHRRPAASSPSRRM
jgi:PiT family inorganic phosphate transporter